MSTKPEDFLGAVLNDKYRLDRLFALQGGQGTVYYATDISTSLNNERVVKQFCPNYDNPKTLNLGTRLFSQESAILEKLGKHSQIPQIFDHFELDKRFYLVQELIEGQNLQQEFDEQKCLSESAIIDLLRDVLNVLSFVHRHNYIHRDIKPSNLIRNKHDGKIYLIDFGAVKEKIIPENIDERGRFKPTIPIGTEGYTPNEQLRGIPNFSSDIYALGMVAIQALTGSHPTNFIVPNSAEAVWRDRIPTTTQNYSPKFLNLLDRMVRSSHLERYQSAAEVLHDLNKINLPSIGDLTPFPQTVERRGDKTVPDRRISDPKPKKSLLPWLIVGISTLGIAVAGALLIGDKETYTAYTNDERGIALVRPESWQLQEDWNAILEPGVTFLSPLVNQKDSFQERVRISVEELTQPLSLNEYTELATAQIEGANTILEPAIPTTFANKEGRKIVYQTQDGTKKLMEVWTINNRKAYLAIYTAEANKFDKYKKQAEKTIQSLAIDY